MTASGVVTRTHNRYEVTFERHLPQAPEQVWAMLTEPRSIAQWFCARVDLDGRPGGQIVEHHDHAGIDIHGEITRWEPPRVFEHSWWFGDSRAGESDSVLWQVFPDGSGTRLVLTDRRRSLEGAEGGIAGRQVCVDVLAAVLEGADPNAHAAPEGEFRDGKFVQSRAGRGLWADGPQIEDDYRRYFATL